MTKPKVAFYWCSSCGGCEEAVVDLDERLLDVAAAVDIVFWPVAMDLKVPDVEALADGAIAAAFINGAVRTDEQRHMAELLRRKAAVVVAFGSCAHLGGIPGLANLTSRAAILESSYLCSPTVVNDEGTLPATRCEVDGCALSLPGFWPAVLPLDRVVDVDYYLPGCAPNPDLVAAAITALLEGQLPPKGSVLAPEKTLCDTCARQKTKTPKKKLSRLYRPHEVVADPEICFLDQGIVCCGPATRSGCGEKCIEGNMPCTGCFGPAPGVADQGAAMLTALATMFELGTDEDAAAIARQVVDAAGTFMRYSVPASVLGGKKEAP
jgi:F420-non-reducing hydrogenase small subunit